jgi:phosphate transport system permease protein
MPDTSFLLRSGNRFWRRTQIVEMLVHTILFAAAAVAVLTTFCIIGTLLIEAIKFFNIVPLNDALFGLHWSPQLALRTDQVAGSGSFGFVPLFWGTFQVTVIALLLAVPTGVTIALFLNEYAPKRLRSIAKPGLEILAGVPTVVYGFFAIAFVGPLLQNSGTAIGIDVTSESALAAGLVIGIMIIPFISSLSDDVIHAVPQTLRDGSSAMGATRYETIRHVVLPSAMPGVMAAILLAVSRAAGETMIVVMAAGMAANLSLNPLTATTTVTVQIVSLLVGDQEFDSPKTLAAYALGFCLFCVTLMLNIWALRIVRKYRKRYE